MSKKDKTLKLALDAFETLTQYNMVRANIFRRFEPTCTGDYVDLREFREKAAPVIAALREALAEQPAQQQEPVAWMFQHEETGRTMCVDAQQVEWGFEKGNPRLKKIAPLYTSPPASKPLVGLTDEEILAVARNHYNPHQRAEISFARAIEAKLKEKNT